MISLLCPTRGRPQQALDLYKSFLNTQKNKNEILFCLQEEDPLLEEYITVFKKNEIKSYFIINSMPTTYIWNKLAKISKGDLLMLIGDDVIIKTNHWDLIVEECTKNFNDRIFVMTVDDGRENQTVPMRCPHPIVHKRWVETLGFFVPPFFSHRYIDAYLRELAIKLDRFIELKDVMFEHRKFMYIHDQTGKRSRKWINEDKFIYENVASRYFQKDLELLSQACNKRPIKKI